MGDFQRTRSKVWWSNFFESGEEVVLRLSSSSPSSSHRSQDSGFSDSEHASPPGPAPAPASECSCPPSLPRLDELDRSDAPPTPPTTPTRSFLDDSQRPSAEVETAATQNSASPKTPSLHSFLSEAAQPSRSASLVEEPLSFSSDKDESIFHHPLCPDLTAAFGPPAHTSTPKSTAAPHKLSKPVRPVNLFKDFKDLSRCQEDRYEACNPVRVWLEEIGGSYDPECMTTLQSKSIAVDLGRQVAEMAAETTSLVQELQDKTKLIAAEFAKLTQQLEYKHLELVPPLVQSLVGNIVEFLYDYGDKQKTEGNKEVVKACDKLRRTAIMKPLNLEEVTSATMDLGHTFTATVDRVLTRHIQGLTNVLENPTSDMAVRAAISSLTTLGIDGSHLNTLIANNGGIQALLSVCLESTASSVRTAALRALATVCSMADTIRQLEQAGGLEILSEILAEESRPEPERSEAAAVVAQITAPWVEDNHSINGLTEHLPSLVQSLTNLISKTDSDETLLLSAAALANLTFLESRTVWPLLEHGSAGHLLSALRQRGPHASVFLQEQAATLLANMAAVPESRPHLAEERAVVALLCFLQIRHSPLQCAKQISAAERVQQKSAIALSRLCSDPVVANEVVQLQGVPRLIRLCKEERERNHSDGVLVASLAALRKIAANCGTKPIEDLDAMELVEPRLLDSFLIYSSRQESYV